MKTLMLIGEENWTEEEAEEVLRLTVDYLKTKEMVKASPFLQFLDSQGDGLKVVK